MSTKIFAWLLSLLSLFASWSPAAQPKHLPETPSSAQYTIWPAEEFTEGKIFPVIPAFLEAWYAVFKDMDLGSVTDSLLILHHGKLVYERYGKGWDEDTAHPMYSVTKAVLSALVGIAIGEGKIESVEQKVIDFYPDAVIAPGQECKLDMTIEHLLTMTSGLPGDNEPEDSEWWEATDSGKAAFETAQPAAPGERFAYSSGSSCQTLAGLIRRAVGKDLLEYAKEKLFIPLGMDSVIWGTAADGLPFGGFGIEMTPRDMLRFGYLYLNNGRWEDEQIIPEAYVAATPPKSKEKSAYGYLFWNFPLLPNDNSFEANGAWGQQIEILPEYDMVIVRTGTQSRFNLFLHGIEDKLDERGLKFW